MIEVYVNNGSFRKMMGKWTFSIVFGVLCTSLHAKVEICRQVFSVTQVCESDREIEIRSQAFDDQGQAHSVSVRYDKQELENQFDAKLVQWMQSKERMKKEIQNVASVKLLL